jgi:hypothetical protein
MLRLTIAVTAAGLALAAVTGCGSDSSSPPELGAGPNVGAPISLADCNDWNDATTEQRLGTIKQLRGFAGGEVVGSGSAPPSGTGAVISDQQAYDLLDGYCKQQFARGFKLYKLYERAASFQGTPAQ